MKTWVQSVVIRRVLLWVTLPLLVAVTNGAPQGRIPWSISFNIFANSLDDGAEWILKNSQAIQRCEQVNVLPVRRDRLENWTKRCLMKFNNEKCGAHLLGRNNPNHLDRLQSNGLGSSFADQELSILVDWRWTWTRSVFLWQTGLIVFRDGISRIWAYPLLITDETHLDFWVQHCASLYKRHGLTGRGH